MTEPTFGAFAPINPLVVAELEAAAAQPAATAPLRGMAWVDAVRSESFLYGLDQLAVFANALGEGIGGDIGDQGEAYGPWQIHLQDGRLPQFHGGDPYDPTVNWWAWSLVGAKYACSKMAESGARRLHGHTAVAHIVRYFERPADIPGAIARRNAIYDNLVKRGSSVWNYLAEHAGGAHASITAQPIAAAQVSAAAARRPNYAWHQLLHFLSVEQPHHLAEINRVIDRLPGLVR